MRRGLAVGIAATLLAASYAASRSCDETTRTLSFVAVVGDHKITNAMLSARRRHIDMYYPGSGTRQAALSQLIQGYLAAEILRREGVILDRSAWIAEQRRIERDSRDPELLARVQSVYENDNDYLLVGVLPDFARSRLARHFRSAPKSFEPTRQAASEFLDRVVNEPSAFAKLAREHGAPILELQADTSMGMRDRAAQDAVSDGDREAARRLIELLGELREGQVHPRTVETPAAYEAVRLLRRLTPSAIEVELAVFRKPDFDEWFLDEASRVPIAIYDSGLHAAFVQEVTWATTLDIERD